MPSKLPPNPVGVAPGSSYWNDWYEKLRLLVDSVTESTGTGLLVRGTGGTLTNPTINGLVVNSPITVNGVPGLSTTVALAKLTGLGTDGSLEFQDGLLTIYVAPT